jgi:hypothetical protein
MMEPSEVTAPPRSLPPRSWPGSWCAANQQRQLTRWRNLPMLGRGDRAMTQDHLKSFERLDGEADAQFIKKISAKPSKAPAASVIDCGNRTVVPGLSDSHVRMVLSEVALPRLDTMPLILLTARAAVLLRNRLERGFPSARDRRRRLRAEGGRRHMAVARRPADRRGQSGARPARPAGAGDVSRRQHEGRTLSPQPVALAR